MTVALAVPVALSPGASASAGTSARQPCPAGERSAPRVGFVEYGDRYVLPVGRHRVWATARGLVFEEFSQRLIGARAAPLEGREPLPGRVNFLRHGLSAARFGEVVQRDAWRGIDVRLRVHDRGLEQDFVVRPGADVRSVRVGYRGIDQLRVARDGSLRIRTGSGVLREHAPVAYQVVGGRRVSVRARFELHGRRSYGFAVGRHRRDLPLVIDPVIAYARYLGGSGAATDLDEVEDVAVDAQGNVYLAGQTNSTDFPGTSGPYKGGSDDAFLTKLTAAGDLVYTTYFGSAERDDGQAVAVLPSGEVVLAGRTRTHAPGFATAGAAQTSNGRTQTTTDALSDDAFVTRLSADGTRTIWTTFLGGGAREVATDIALDGAGNVVVGGSTDSLDFPLASAAQPTPGGGQPPTPDGQSDNVDAFVTTVRADGGAFLSSTYLGGGEDETGLGVAVDAAGDAYSAGVTASEDFPTRNPIQPFRGPGDGFVTKLSGAAFAYSTLIGGSGTDAAAGIAVDASGRAWLTGDTASDDFPRAGAFQSARTGTGNDAFVAALAPDGRSLFKSSYLGGDADDRGTAITVGGDGAVYLTGESRSVAGFPWRQELRRSAGDRDAFVAKLVRGELDYATHLGGSQADRGNGIAVTAAGEVVVGGFTQSGNFQGATGAGRRGLQDGFVAQLAPGPSEPGTPPGGGGPGGGGPAGGGPGGAGGTTQPGTGIPYVYADILGRPQFRPNRTFYTQIVFGNTGGRAGYGVPLWIDGIPAGAQWSLISSVDKVTASGPVFVPDEAAAVRHGDKLLLPLVLPAIPANSTGTLTLAITTDKQFTLRAWADPPLVPVPDVAARAAQDGTTAIPQALEDCFAGVLNYAFDKVAGGVIPDACVKYVADKVLKRVGFEADKFFRDLLGSNGNWTPRVVSWRQTILEGLKEVRSAINACGPALAALNVEAVTARMLIEMSKALADLESTNANAKLLADCGRALTAGAGAIPDNLPGGGTSGGAYPGTEQTSTPSNSYDPNDKVGPPGRFGGGWVTGSEPLRYAIFFENLARATAAAQEVVITDRLDRSKVDLASVRFGRVGFGDRHFGPASPSPALTTDVQLRPDLLVRVEASLDRASGVATWRLRALDPFTLGLPSDPLAGFLPPNRTPPEGEGYVTLFAQPRAGLRNGTAITNRATIVFDDNAPIATRTVRNRIDRTPPASRVTSVRWRRDGRMRVRWTSRDRGAGAARYAVYASENGAPFRLVRAGLRRRSLSFRGRAGRRYAFLVSATDRAGNAEPPAAVGDLFAPAVRVVGRRVTVSTYAAWPGRLTASVTGAGGGRIRLLRGSRLGTARARSATRSLSARIGRPGRVRLALRIGRGTPGTLVVRSPRGGPLRIPLR